MRRRRALPISCMPNRKPPSDFILTAFPRRLTTTTGNCGDIQNLPGLHVWKARYGMSMPGMCLHPACRSVSACFSTLPRSPERRARRGCGSFCADPNPEYAPDTHPELDAAAACAVRYFLEVLRPRRSWHHPDPREAEAIRALRDALAAHPGEATAEALQGDRL